jgi:hypothetical protein
MLLFCFLVLIPDGVCVNLDFHDDFEGKGKPWMYNVLCNCVPLDLTNVLVFLVLNVSSTYSVNRIIAPLIIRKNSCICKYTHLERVAAPFLQFSYS